MRYNSRVDSIQKDVVLELRRAGASVRVLSALGSGMPDILAGFGGKNYLLELKSSTSAKLTPDEREFFESWSGSAYIVCSPDEALAVVLQSGTERYR